MNPHRRSTTFSAIVQFAQEPNQKEKEIFTRTVYSTNSSFILLQNNFFLFVTFLSSILSQKLLKSDDPNFAQEMNNSALIIGISY